MRAMRWIVTIGLMTTLVLAGAAAALGESLDVQRTVTAGGESASAAGHAFADTDDRVAQATGSVTSDDATASGETLVNATSRYADGDADVATDGAGAMLDTDASVSDPEDAENGVWTWLEVNYGAFLTRLGLAENGGLTIFASDDGVDVDGSVHGEDFDDSEAGDADDQTWSVIAKVKAFFAGLG